MLGALNLASRILAVRLILLLAVIGSALLTWLALQEHDPLRLIAVGIYTFTVVCPLIWLSSRP